MHARLTVRVGGDGFALRDLPALASLGCSNATCAATCAAVAATAFLAAERCQRRKIAQCEAVAADAHREPRVHLTTPATPHQ